MDTLNQQEPAAALPVTYKYRSPTLGKVALGLLLEEATRSSPSSLEVSKETMVLANILKNFMARMSVLEDLVEELSRGVDINQVSLRSLKLQELLVSANAGADPGQLAMECLKRNSFNVSASYLSRFTESRRAMKILRAMEVSYSVETSEGSGIYWRTSTAGDSRMNLESDLEEEEAPEVEEILSKKGRIIVDVDTGMEHKP